MAEESVGRRYAAALFSLAQKQNRLEEARRELSTVANTVAQSSRLRVILHEPFLGEAKKKDALLTVFGATISKSTMAFLNLMVDKRRLDVLPETEAEFTKMVRAHLNVEEATATSAIPLSPDETQKLTQSLQVRTGKTIELTTTVDPSVLGGVLVRIGDTVWDGTVKGNLERLRERLTESR